MKSLIFSMSVFLFLAFSAADLSAKKGRFVSYKSSGDSYQGYYVSAGKNAPFVLLIHDWDGLTDYEVKRSDMLAKEGFSVFALDLFGKGIRPTKLEDKRKHTGELYKDRKKMRRLMYRALQIAKRRGANVNNAVVAGYCFGGAAVLELARSGAKLKGFATFHGGLATPKEQNYSKTKGKILVMHGSSDKFISMDDFANLAKELEEAKINHEMVTYGGARHAFTVFGIDRYNKNADQKSWELFLSFLNENLKS